MRWFEKLSKITGRLALLSEEEAECLAKYASLPGDHVEIGCLWGGTAIIAAMAKQEAGVEGQVYTIDPMVGGWWTIEDPVVRMRPTPEIIRSNFAKFKVSNWVEVVHASSSPWPLPSVRPVTILIDGDHSFEAVSQDWKNASKFATQYILMHDCNSPAHPGVAKALEDVVMADAKWQHTESVGSMMVFERAPVPVKVAKPVAKPVVKPAEPVVEPVKPVAKPVAPAAPLVKYPVKPDRKPGRKSG